MVNSLGIKSRVNPSPYSEWGDSNHIQEVTGFSLEREINLTHPSLPSK